MSLKDSKDPVEQLYGSVILKHFPNYERFWVKFIGDPNAERVQPYKYLFPRNIALEKKKKIERNYEKIQMAHYTMFCHLAGALFQEKELVKAGSIQDLKERYFRCCEHFESAYMHLGSALYVLETLWNTVLKLSGYRGGGGRFGKLENYLNQRGKGGLAQRLRNIDGTMMIRRHLPVHYGAKDISLDLS